MIPVIQQVHAALAQSIVVFFLILALWAFATHVRGPRFRLSSGFWGTAFIGEGLFIAQMALGFIMVASGRAPAQIVHLLYGLVGVLVLPVAYGYSPRYGERQALVMGIVCIFLFGVALRAISSARP